MDTEARTSAQRTTVNRAGRRCERTEDRRRRDVGIFGAPRGGFALLLPSGHQPGPGAGRPPARRIPVPPGGDASLTACALFAATARRSVSGTHRIASESRNTLSKNR